MASKEKTSGSGASAKGRGGDSHQQRSASHSASPSRENGNASRGKMNAAEAVQEARSQLGQLLGRPVEAVLGVDRDRSHWVVAAEVLELARVPNTTDVLGEYHATLDGDGELVGFKQRRRYLRGQTSGDDS